MIDLSKIVESEAVLFYQAGAKPYGCFSNLYKRAMEFEGRIFPTAEHAYQFGKPRTQKCREWLMGAPTPSLLAGAAHSLNWWDIRPGWSREKQDRMRAVVEAKFRQHEDLADILLSTGPKRLIEFGGADNDVNRRWGMVLRNGELVGQNWLGLILMDVRSMLTMERKEQQKGGAD